MGALVLAWGGTTPADGGAVGSGWFTSDRALWHGRGDGRGRSGKRRGAMGNVGLGARG